MFRSVGLAGHHHPQRQAGPAHRPLRGRRGTFSSSGERRPEPVRAGRQVQACLLIKLFIMSATTASLAVVLCWYLMLAAVVE